ncbi:hypothetical protein NIASO_04910 [Niabella soli DSM 19437]|uniref:Uncharacterized protein n=1 Tax=Niabella soli DSM 19437 TaxID=929713 RepID=W0F640_9BACT|nr:hypothetical protein NIASO_04910 [Niabella soli DSM 19437]
MQGSVVKHACGNGEAGPDIIINFNPQGKRLLIYKKNINERLS